MFIVYELVTKDTLCIWKDGTSRIGQHLAQAIEFQAKFFCFVYCFRVDAVHTWNRLAQKCLFCLLYQVCALHVQSRLVFSTSKTFFVYCIVSMHRSLRYGQLLAQTKLFVLSIVSGRCTAHVELVRVLSRICFCFVYFVVLGRCIALVEQVSTQHKKILLFCLLYHVDALHTENWLALSTKKKTCCFVNCIRTMHCTCRIGQSTQHKQNFLFCILYRVYALHLQNRLSLGKSKTLCLSIVSMHCTYRIGQLLARTIFCQLYKVDALYMQNLLEHLAQAKLLFFVYCYGG